MAKPAMGGNAQLLQTINRTKVLDFIRRHPRATRPMIAEGTGLALSSITNIVTFLLSSSLVQECAPETTGLVGRRALPLIMDNGRSALLCADVRPGHVAVSAVSLQGNVLREREARLESGCSGESLARAVGACANALRGESPVPPLALCVTVPGMVLDGGRRIRSVRLMWRDEDLYGPLAAMLDMPLFVMNVSVAKAIGAAKSLEAQGSLAHNAAFLDLEGGLGVVQLIGGRERLEVIGEIGHITVDPAGERCFCGNIGCLEAYCSPERIVRDARAAREAGGEADGALTFERLLAEDLSGDETARAAFARGGMYLGIGITGVLHMLHPAAVYLGGGGLLRSGTLFEAARQWVMGRAYPQLSEGLTMTAVDCGEDTIRDGQVNFMLDRLFDYTSPLCVIGGGA